MKRHSTDLVSLAFGLIFAGIAGWWLIGRYLLDVHLNIPNLGLFMAGALILLGLLGIVGSLRRERRAEPATTPAPTAAAGNATTGERAREQAETDPYPGERLPEEPYPDEPYPRGSVADTAELSDPVPPSEDDEQTR